MTNWVKQVKTVEELLTALSELSEITPMGAYSQSSGGYFKLDCAVVNDRFVFPLKALLGVIITVGHFRRVLTALPPLMRLANYPGGIGIYVNDSGVIITCDYDCSDNFNGVMIWRK